MPVRDHDIERAFRAAAPPVDATGVLERVAAKRARRRALRTTRTGLLAVVGALAIVGSVVLLARDEDPSRVSTPVATTPGTTPVTLTPDENWYLRGPLTVSGDLVSVAAYEQEAKAFRFPPSYIVRVEPDTLEVVDRVKLEAEIRSVADGADGVRWAVTRNPDPEPPLTAGLFLKRIAPDGHVESFPLPPGTEMTGDVVVEPQRVLVPTQAGTLTFAPDGTRGEVDRAFSATYTDVAVPGFVAETMRSAGPRTWVTGTLDGEPAVVLLDGTTVVDTISLPGRDVSFAWVDDDTVLATRDGRLLRIDVGG